MSDAARRAAFDCVLAVDREGAYANLVMPTILTRAGLAGRDAAFATELAFGSLRMSGLYEAVLARATGRDVRSLDDVVRVVLTLGAHQWLGMRTPAHATVSETVDLAKREGAGRASGLVNAAMRRITEATREEWLERVAAGNSHAALAVRHSHPEWVVDELAESLERRDRGGSLEALLAAHNEPAGVTLVARPGLMSREALAGEAGGAGTPLSPWGVALPGGNPGSLAAIASGTAGVQDEGSQLVAGALTTDAARPSTRGERWLDACAGPGGKVAILGALAAQRGASVDALELHPHRAGLVRGAVQALPPGAVSIHVADATEWVGGPYDRILVDAPCTGLGALRRRPESRWRRGPADLVDLSALQSALLAHAASLLAPGGVIAYVTCSPVLAETVEVVAASGLVLCDARPALAELTGTQPHRWGTDADVQLWTDRDGTDSMYLALLAQPSER